MANYKKKKKIPAALPTGEKARILLFRKIPGLWPSGNSYLSLELWGLYVPSSGLDGFVPIPGLYNQKPVNLMTKITL